MRLAVRLLIAGALAIAGLVGGPVLAQPNQGPSPSDVAAMANWAQKILAAQEPALAAYARCQPVSERVVANLADREALKAVVPEYIRCLADVEAAVKQAGQALAAVGGLPPRSEALLGMTAAETLKRSRDTLDRIALSMRQLRIGVEAAAANDLDTAQAAMRNVRDGMVATIDGQILQLSIMAKASPTASTRALMDVRLLLSRIIRTAIVAPMDASSAQVGNSLRALAPQARATAANLRETWTREAREPQRHFARTNDKANLSKLKKLDQVFVAIAGRSDDVAVALDHAPIGTASAAEMQKFLAEIAAAEVFVVRSAASISTMIAQEGR